MPKTDKYMVVTSTDFHATVKNGMVKSLEIDPRDFATDETDAFRLLSFAVNNPNEWERFITAINDAQKGTK